MTIKTVYGDEYLTVTLSDTYGGQTLNISHTEHFKNLIKWIDDHRARELQEQLLRDSNPEVKLAYDAYKMAVAMHT